MSWDWDSLRRLRSRFLSGTPGGEDYWESEATLAAYDATYAQRIAWKWFAVFEDLDRIGWKPPQGGVLLDWGCGSGVASRAVIGWAGEPHFERLALWDRSPAAMQFASKRAAERFPELPVGGHEPGPISLLVISHVLNELDAESEAQLLEAVSRSAAVLWVEPGTYAESRRLGHLREKLRGDFGIVSPCPHERSCGVLGPGCERDWCHFFARPPTDVFTSPDWAAFAKEVGVDLRSLPYCHLVLDRDPSRFERPSGWRLLGRHGVDKVAVRTLACRPSGAVEPQAFGWRAEAALCKRLEKKPHTSWIPREEGPG